MSDRVTVSLQALPGRISRDLARLRRRGSKAVARTANKAVKIVQRNAPKAFGELVDSVRATDTQTIVSAPHAAAVEAGSRPHLVPLEDLVRWVKLRGMQGLSDSGKVRSQAWKASGMGSSTSANARRVSRELKQMRGQNTFNAIDDPEKIAKRIQGSIAKNGTKPFRFVMKSLPEVADLLHSEMQRALK